MKKVLLIDDDPVTNFINKKLIENTGLPYEIAVALNGKQGLEIMMGNRNKQLQLPDVIIVDINMPLINGFEFLQQLLKSTDISNIKIAILSSSDNIEDKARARSLGIRYYFVKPITIDSLKRILE